MYQECKASETSMYATIPQSVLTQPGIHRHCVCNIIQYVYHFWLLSHSFFLQDDDFKFNETTVQFPMYASPRLAADTTDVDLHITIVGDDINEERECFTCTIHNSVVPEKELRCPPQTTTICIVDPGGYTIFPAG